MKINFEKIAYQNTLSSGNYWTEIEFDTHKSTLIYGDNGAGKSTVYEALTFALFGKPFRNINKGQLINSITNKNMLVHLWFSIGSTRYRIERGQKPTIFKIFINDEEMKSIGAREDQEFLEQKICKWNFKTYTQIVVLGSANYKPFMMLTAGERRAVVENLLDISVFSTMNSLLKNRVADNNDQIKDINVSIDKLETKIDLETKHIEELQQNNDELIKEKRDKILALECSIQGCIVDNEEINEKTESLLGEIEDKSKAEKLKTELLKFESSFEEKRRVLTKEIKFFRDNDNCPTCKQEIDSDFRDSVIDEKEEEKAKILSAEEKLEEKIKANLARLEEISEIQKQISSLNNSINSNNTSISISQRSIRELNSEIEALETKKQKLSGQSENIDELTNELRESKLAKKALMEDKEVMNVAAKLLKDTGIKAQIVDQYIPIMNTLINKYLADMELMADFQLDNNFNETILARYCDGYSYESFSEGEKTRLDVALLLTWRSIAKMRNSTSTNILIMDEVLDSSLDAQGIDDMNKIFTEVCKDSNIFIISHRSGEDQTDSFERLIKFEKQGNFGKRVL